VKIVNIHASSPTTLWRRFGSLSGLSRSEFFDYFNGVAAGVALVLENAQRLRRSLSLDVLREIADGFQPPQFFVRLSAKHPFLGAIASTR
jgi:predicted transcriptional regulator